MVHDTIENSERYESLNPNFKVALEHLRETDFSKKEPCKYALNEDVCVIVSVIEGHKSSESEVELHDDFIDIQMPLNITEAMGWIARKNLKNVTVPYSKSDDIAFFAEKATDFVEVKPHEFVIFFPEDGHQPCIADGEIKKVIIKVRK